MIAKQEFDPTRQGKHVTSFRDIFPDDDRATTDDIVCINRGDGPSVVLTGGIHGDEYEAQLVLRRLAKTLQAEDVVGRVIIIPSLNYPAAHDGRRVSAEDGQNMNREFPGIADGTITQKLSAFLTERIFPVCSFLVDVHAGGAGCTVVPMIFGFTSPACDISESALNALMEAWGYRYVQHVTPVASTSCGAALAAGIASVEIEGGGGSRLLGAEMELMYQNLLRGLAAYGVLTTPLAQPHPDQADHSIHFDAGPDNQWLAPRAGIIEHTVQLHDFVEQGEVVAHLHAADGSYETLPITSPVSGYIVRLTSKVYIRKGELIGNNGTPRRA